MSTGILLVISGPSGAGKSTVCRSLLKTWPKLRYSVSCTTRPPRSNEVNGRDYWFLSEAEFQKKVKDKEFLEWARVHDCSYGTLREPLMDPLHRGYDVILDVDPQGALSIKDSFSQSVAVYICPPSWEMLEDRLRGRAQDNEDTIAKRLANARQEMTYLIHYDYMVVNKDLKETVDDVSAILRAEHRRMSRLAHELNRLEIMEEDKA